MKTILLMDIVIAVFGIYLGAIAFQMKRTGKINSVVVPVIETGAGICHLYVDQEANLDMALEIAKNAKIQRHILTVRFHI
mgnify:CR=1 FL=1